MIQGTDVKITWFATSVRSGHKTRFIFSPAGNTSSAFILPLYKPYHQRDRQQPNRGSNRKHHSNWHQKFKQVSCTVRGGYAYLALQHVAATPFSLSFAASKSASHPAADTSFAYRKSTIQHVAAIFYYHLQQASRCLITQRPDPLLSPAPGKAALQHAAAIFFCHLQQASRHHIPQRIYSSFYSKQQQQRGRRQR